MKSDETCHSISAPMACNPHRRRLGAPGERFVVLQMTGACGVKEILAAELGLREAPDDVKPAARTL